MTRRFDDSARGPRETHIPDSLGPDALTVDWFREQAALHEKTLRRQYAPTGEKPFPPEWEKALAAFDPEKSVGALRRWAYLKHLLWVRDENLSKRGDETDEAKILAAYQLITMEPVPVTLSTGRMVEVTDRSLAALVEMGRHATTIAGLFDDLERADEIIARILEKIAGDDVSRHRKRALRRRLQWVRNVKLRAMPELSLHRKAVYAHVFTESGAPAKGVDDAPVWWDEITRDDEKRIMEAASEAGSGRYEKLGPQPKPPKRKDSKTRWRYLESFGLLSPLTRWGLDVPITEAPYYDRPLGQAFAFMRAGADPVMEDVGG